MSHRSAESGRQHGLSRSSSSSSTSSSTSSSSSSSPHHGRHQHASHHRKSSKTRSGTRSRSSSSGSSRSRTRSRSRSRERHHHRHSRGHSRERDGSNYDRSEEAGELSNLQEIDDSIRSDKSSKPATNGGAGNVAATALGDRRMPGGHSQSLKPPTSSSRLSGIQFGKPGTVLRPGIHMKLAQPKPSTEPTKKITIASAFNNDSDDEVEEMPPECKMRMRNIGRDTPTSSGPNSFGKTKQGFVDSKKLFEKSLREAAME